MTATEIQDRTIAQTRWTVDSDETSVEFAVKTFWGLMTVHGRFDRFDGSYEVGPGGTTIELTIDADSLDTGHATRDKHLRSTDFFHVAAHPQVRFTSTRVHHVTGEACTSWAVSRQQAMSWSSSSPPSYRSSATRSRSRPPRRSTRGGSA